jgi:hypothetical protein
MLVVAKDRNRDPSGTAAGGKRTRTETDASAVEAAGATAHAPFASTSAADDCDAPACAGSSDVDGRLGNDVDAAAAKAARKAAKRAKKAVEAGLTEAEAESARAKAKERRKANKAAGKAKKKEWLDGHA